MVSKSIFRKIFIYFITIVFFIISTGCIKKEQEMFLNSEYSEILTIDAAMSGSMVAETVDLIKIYNLKGKSGPKYTLNELRDLKPVLETDDKKLITKIIIASQDTIMNITGCYENQRNESFHILAFDEATKKVGYFTYTLCDVDSARYGIVYPLQKGGSGNIYFNNKLWQILEQIEKP